MSSVQLLQFMYHIEVKTSKLKDGKP